MPDSSRITDIPALAAGRVAVITGAASGIGFAAARRLASAGMKIVMADREGPSLTQSARIVAAMAENRDEDVLAVPCDVAKPLDVIQLADAAFAKFGSVSFLMNNAGVGNNPGKPWENQVAWKQLMDVNLWGVVHGVGAFMERMLQPGEPAIIVNTGSKQGITTPPGNLAYNVSKSAVKTYTEGLAHALRNLPEGRVSAHLLIPGFTYTGMTTGVSEKPAGAWSGDEVIAFMLQALARGDFYILCQDNETTREMDEKRMAWAMGDVIENRPALSRWHPDHKDAFEAFMAGSRAP